MIKKAILPVIAVSLGLLSIFAYTRRDNDDTAGPAHTPAPVAASTLAPTQTPPPTPTQQAETQVAVTPSPTMTMTPEPTPVASVVVGQPMTYTLTITNYGPSNATGVIITDVLPAGVEFISATSPYTAGNASGQGVLCSANDVSGGPAKGPISPTVILCDIGDMVQGASASVTVVARPITVTEMTHAAIVVANETDPETQGNVFDEQTAVRPAADLSIRPDGSTAVAGRTLIYTLTVTNEGPSPATGVVITDILPLGATLAWSRPSQPACGLLDGVLTCDLGQLDKGAATLTFDIAPGATDTTVLEELPLGVTLDVPGPTCRHDDGVVTCSLGDLQAGENSHVIVAATVHPLITGTFTNTAAVMAHEIDPDLLNNDLAAGVAVSASLNLTATTVPTAAGLTLHASAPRHVIAGRPLTYTFTVTNNGPLDATGVTLEADLVMDNSRTGMSLVSRTHEAPDCIHSDETMTCYLQNPDTGDTITLTLVLIATDTDASLDLKILDMFLSSWPSCALGPGGLLCRLGNVKSGDRTQVTVVAVAGSLLTGTITRTATLAADGFEPNPLDNVALITATSTVQTDLAIQSQVSEPVVAGKALTYTFTITNHGPSTANGVLLTDTLPPGVQFVSATASKKVKCEPSKTLTNTVACNLYGLDSGVVITLSIVALVDDLTVGAITNLAVVASAGQTDSDTSNNQATQSIQVSPVADLSITDQ